MITESFELCWTFMLAVVVCHAWVEAPSHPTLLQGTNWSIPQCDIKLLFKNNSSKQPNNFESRKLSPVPLVVLKILKHLTHSLREIYKNHPVNAKQGAKK